MTSENRFDISRLAQALAILGRNESARRAVFNALREAEGQAGDPVSFRDEVRWPLILSMLQQVDEHKVTLANGLTIEIGPDSRIERALLLSPKEHPDCVWEPQTTKLVTQLAGSASNIIVGGAYIGDHVLFMAHAAGGHQGVVHAFEPMALSYKRLIRNLQLNQINNVVAHRMALWDRSGVKLKLEGSLALAFASDDGDQATMTDVIDSIAIDDYVRSEDLSLVELVMLDIEGGDEKALRDARQLLSRSTASAPHIVFEIHRNYIDWTNGLENTSMVQFLMSRGYEAYAIRDSHGDHLGETSPIEIIPIPRVYLDGPPHGFNVLATRDTYLVERLGLRTVEDVSPKLLRDKNPALHHPLSGWE